MASEKRLNLKKLQVKEIEEKLSKNKTFLLLDYQGMSVSDISKLRRSLRESKSEIKVYKNTLMDLALKERNIDLTEFMTGPNAFLFSDDIIDPIKIVSAFAKDVPSLEIRVGYIDGEIANKELIDKYASIPSMEGLLTQLAGGLMEHVRNLSIGLNMYADKLENEGGEK
ncbi:MAG: 50S ribosomal protein L10 [Bacilli bacterium]